MLWVIGVGFVVTTAMFAVRFARTQRASKIVPTAIASAAEGVQIRIRGTVSAPEPLRAPLTGRPCAYHRLEFRTWEGNRVLLHEAASAVDFVVTDQTGVAQVLAERATFEIVADIVEMGRASALSGRALEALKHTGWRVPELGRIELCEAVVEVGPPIDVYGEATREPIAAANAGERGYRDGIASVLVFSAGHRVHETPRERRYLGNR